MNVFYSIFIVFLQYKCPQLDLEKKTLFRTYTGQTIFNIDGITIHSSIFMPLNCKKYHN